MPKQNKEKIKLRVRFLSLIVLFGLALFACSNNEHLRDLSNYIESLKKTIIKQKKNSIAEMRFPTSVTFQSQGKQRDPFATQAASYSGGTVTNPLTAFQVKMFELIGTISRDNQLWAIIKAPDNKVYEMTIGDQIGDHYGKIIKIYPDRVQIEEEISEPGQGMTQRTVTLELKGKT